MTAGRSMSEDAGATPDAPTQHTPSYTGLTAGAALRNARENAGLHIATLAGVLKVPVRKLEALESDHLELLPDAVFARALAASICRTLKLDPGPVLSLLPGQAAPPLLPGIKISTASFDRPGMGWRVPLFSRLPKAVVVTASVLVAAALALLFVPSLDRLKSKFGKAPADAVFSDGSGAAPATSVSETSGARASAQAISSAGSEAPFAIAAVPAGSPIAPAPAVTAASSDSLLATGADTRTTGTGLVVFQARGSSWVEVTDAGGVVQLRKTMVSGESANASGTLPLSVIVGRADSTDVLVRGKSFDLVPLTKDNVARFQIK